jgi:hypothetical protein
MPPPPFSPEMMKHKHLCNVPTGLSAHGTGHMPALTICCSEPAHTDRKQVQPSWLLHTHLPGPSNAQRGSGSPKQTLCMPHCGLVGCLEQAQTCCWAVGVPHGAALPAHSLHPVQHIPLTSGPAYGWSTGSRPHHNPAIAAHNLRPPSHLYPVGRCSLQPHRCVRLRWVGKAPQYATLIYGHVNAPASAPPPRPRWYLQSAHQCHTCRCLVALLHQEGCCIQARGQSLRLAPGCLARRSSS